MNVNDMLAEIQKTKVQWQHEAKSGDIEGNTRTWINGVVFGLDMAIKIIQGHRSTRG